jgi:isoleucyl-tRNA synthetase
VLVLLDPTVTPAAKTEAVARECVNRVQKLRKKAGLMPTDDVRMEFEIIGEDTAGIKNAVLTHEDMVEEKVRGKLVESQNDDKTGLIIEEEQRVADVNFLLRLLKL